MYLYILLRPPRPWLLGRPDPTQTKTQTQTQTHVVVDSINHLTSFIDKNNFISNTISNILLKNQKSKIKIKIRTKLDKLLTLNEENETIVFQTTYLHKFPTRGVFMIDPRVVSTKERKGLDDS